MIIENPDAFKSWLTSILEPLCDADPAALAKYVYALVKKDKPLSELRGGMLDQLDVFLQHETKPFVDMLFKSLETQEYLTTAAEEPLHDGEKPPSPTPGADEKVDEAPVHATTNGKTLEERLGKPPAEQRAEPQEVTGVTPAPAPGRHRVVMRSKPPHEHTLVKASLPLTELLEEPLEPPRRRDRRDGLRDGPGPDRRRRRSRSWERRVGTARRRPHRDQDHDRGYERRRPISRSPSPRGRYRNRSPPNNVERPPTRSRSRSPAGIIRERERDGRLQRVRSADRDRASRDREHRERQSRERDRDRSRSRERSLSASERGDHHEYSKRRCRDFDEKGYCMRGDLCQWDHGLDPVVLEDACLTRALIPPQHPPVPEYNPLTPDIWTGAGGPFPAYPPRPPLPPLGLPPHHPAHHAHAPRELIPIPRVRDEAAGALAAPLPSLPPRHATHATHATHAPPNSHKKNFDYNRLGKGPIRPPPLPANAANCSLEVKKVPRGLNDITHLNNHFSKFGKIVNIQVCFGGDPEGALITFSSPAEANVAYKSTEAVLNNRFIKVFWHNPENKQENQPPNNKQSERSERALNQHPLSNNKVLVNRVQPTRAVEAACAQAKQEEGIKAAEKAAAEPPKDVKKENTPLPATPSTPATPAAGREGEMYKRAQALLETQIHQQLLLINKLESGNVSGPARAALLSAISSAQEGIEKLRAELVAYNKALRQAAIQQKKPKTREEAQKEILDAELDMFTKQQEGQDVTELAKRIADLRRQLALQFPHPASRRPHGRGGRFSSTRINRIGAAAAPKVFNNQVVDHRPRALLVSGFEPEELDSLVAHFAQYGAITGKEVNLAVPELTVQYAARAHAEQALVRARHYNDRTLSITWVTGNKPIGQGAVTPVTPAPVTPVTPVTPVAPSAQNGEAMEETKGHETPSASSDLLLEEEEDEDLEDRSWRR